MIPGPSSLREVVPSDAPAENLAELTDSELLARFFGQHEDAAFETLVHRHGALVYGVCRRVLQNARDAEDAFQATFLILVRKGSQLQQPERLSNWLYGVAYRTARKFRTQAALRSKRESQAQCMAAANSPNEMTLEELRAILDDEISQLPDKYALPLVLCYLEGKTNAQAAAQLGWPEGSMSRRLSKARELLRNRLTRRGLAFSGVLLTFAFAPRAEASFPQHLAAKMATAGRRYLGGAPAKQLVSNRAARAVDEMLASTIVGGKLKVTGSMIAFALTVALSIVGCDLVAPKFGENLRNLTFLKGWGGASNSTIPPGSIRHSGCASSQPVALPPQGAACETLGSPVQ